MRTVWTVAASVVLLGVGAVALTVAAPVPKELKREPVGCTIQGEATCEAGASPELTVSLTNQTKDDIQLVGTLDGSGSKMRYPHCFFEVTGPDGKPVIKTGARCRNTNPLVSTDFVKVPAGKSHDPYLTADGKRWTPSEVSGDVFDKPGKYSIRFVYSTDCDDLLKWAGDGGKETAADMVIVARFQKVPKVEIRSDEFVLTVTAASK